MQGDTVVSFPTDFKKHHSLCCKKQINIIKSSNQELGLGVVLSVNVSIVNPVSHENQGTKKSKQTKALWFF